MWGLKKPFKNKYTVGETFTSTPPKVLKVVS